MNKLKNLVFALVTVCWFANSNSIYTVTYPQQLQVQNTLNTEISNDTIPQNILNKFLDVYKKLEQNTQIQRNESLRRYYQKESDPSKMITKIKSAILGIPKGDTFLFVTVEATYLKNWTIKVTFTSQFDCKTLSPISLDSDGFIDYETLDFIKDKSNSYGYDAKETKNQCISIAPACIPVNTPFPQ